MESVRKIRVLFGIPSTRSAFLRTLIGFLVIAGLINIILIVLYPQFYRENLFGRLKPSTIQNLNGERIRNIKNHRSIKYNRILSIRHENRILTSFGAVNELDGISKSEFLPSGTVSRPSLSTRNIARPSRKNNNFDYTSISSKERFLPTNEALGKTNEPSPTQTLLQKSREKSMQTTMRPTNIVSSVKSDPELDDTIKPSSKGYLVDLKPIKTPSLKVLMTSAEISNKTVFISSSNKFSDFSKMNVSNQYLSDIASTRYSKTSGSIPLTKATENSEENTMIIPRNETSRGRNLTKNGLKQDQQYNSTKRGSSPGKLNPTKASSKLTTTSQQSSSEYVSCKPYVLSAKAIAYTTKQYKLNPNVMKCKDQKTPPYVLCKVDETKINDSFTELQFKCNFSTCDRTKKIFIERMDPKDGLMKRHEIPKDSNDAEIEKLVHNFAENTRQNSLPFLFLNCSDRQTKGVVTQLLSFLPSLPLLKDPKTRNKVNINMLLVDSVSRPHFYRSFPKTINYLKEIQKDQNYPANVFNFELFQAVHGHTNENERALFNGSLFPVHLNPKVRDRTPVNLDRLYAVFKEAGFQTMFLDDLCWRAHWGIMDKYKIGSWQSLQKNLRVSSIDTRGITESSCALLNRNNMATPFYAHSTHQICFNGKHQHEYVLDYLTKYLDAVGDTPQSKPLFAYTSTHVSHDNVGIRVQTLDTHLKEHIQQMSTKDKTLTIIFADHGNTYTSYQASLEDGKQEMYHPFMLMILPKTLGETFGKTVLRNLMNNQRRLFTLFDVREGLLELARFDGLSPLKPAGIFGKLATNRTCDDLLITEESKCICQRWETPVANTTDQLAFGEFAIGQLNNKIQASLLDLRANGIPQNKSHLVFGACQRLRVQNIKNVKTRKMRDGTRATTMDVKVQSGNLLDQVEIITVQVLWKERTRGTYEMALLSFNRISTYGPYKTCLDKGVDVKLCVCNKPKDPRPPTTIEDVFGKQSEITKLRRCLYEIRRTYSDSKNAGAMVEVIEIVNVCRNKEFTVIFDAFSEDVIMSTKLPITIKLPVQTAQFVATARVMGNKITKLGVTWRVDDNKNSKSA